ncbi:MAG: ABC transporter permease [Lachnospiraceae bacterium]|nr:ABC transporter permease [Lachnospiraceae bacterium]
MKNPLRKRLGREIVHELGKYMVVFLFMTLFIGFCSGFLVAGGSMITAYDESFERYQIEDGHFVLEKEASDDVIRKMEEEGVQITPDFYLEEESRLEGEERDASTLRIYACRERVNQVCEMQGRLPAGENEIAIDRMYADNNEIGVGDILLIRGRRLTVTGLVALPDYSALFSDNSDMMFDAVKFGVAVMTEKGMDAFDDGAKRYYQYDWRYNTAPADEEQEKEKSEEFMKAVAGLSEIKDFLPRYLNQAIQFTGDDMGGDRSMILVLLYILIVILAFVFSVTIRHTIVREAAVIGTLRASGYTRGELLRHYLALPFLVTAFSALMGNVLGYTVFKDVVAGLYYSSYSLPTYHTILNGEAFVLTTVIPVILMLITNSVSLLHSLRLSPLQFIRRDFRRNRRQGARSFSVSFGSFFHRFRLRIILQNISSYLTLFVGIVFANVILLFGMMMVPLLSQYQEEVVAHMLADYQYVLKTQVETEEESAEKFCITSLKYEENGNDEEVSIYGIAEDSRYVEAAMPEQGVIISDSLADKYRIEPGSTLFLKETYGTERYSFTVEGVMEYPAGMAVFMSDDTFIRTFDVHINPFDIGTMDMELLLHRLSTPAQYKYFNGYFSEKKINDLDETYVDSCITKDDLTKVSRQLDVSMGGMFKFVTIFAIVLFALLIYLLTKLVLEKNTASISMVKILGYTNGEIARLYLAATTVVVIVSLVLGFFAATSIIEIVYRAMISDFSGWLPLYIGTDTYVKMFFMGLAAYFAVSLLQFFKIRKIPMDEALKNVE